jgi:hypothetical protein
VTAPLPMVPLSGKTAADLVDLLGELAAFPHLRHRANDLVKLIGEAAAIAGEHVDEHEMWCMELLECVGQATGRALSTIATRENLLLAKDALSHTVPVLGANVITLPLAPARETAASMDAAAAKAVLDMAGPLSVRLWVDQREVDPFETWAAPREREVLERPDGSRALVYFVRRSGPNAFNVSALTMCKPGEATW